MIYGQVVWRGAFSTHIGVLICWCQKQYWLAGAPVPRLYCRCGGYVSPPCSYRALSPDRLGWLVLTLELFALDRDRLGIEASTCGSRRAAWHLTASLTAAEC